MPLDPAQRHQIEQDAITAGWTVAHDQKKGRTMTKLTETQIIVLTAGAKRPDNIALPLPKGLAGAAAKMAVAKMMEHGWLEEVDANTRRGEPLWRETGEDSQRFGMLRYISEDIRCSGPANRHGR